jgi:RNA polymerase sigma-70 factor (sigma-E family)
METAMADPEMVRFVEAMHPRLVGGLSLYCGDRSAAEEIAQESLVRVWDRWSRVRAMESASGWTWAVALNLARSRHRRRAIERRAVERLPRPIPHQDPDAADTVAVRRAVAALPERQRQALVLRYYADLTVHDTAGVMDCADGTVKALTSQAIAALRLSLGPVDIEEVADHA